jgi:hypothetical protein
VPVNAAQPSRYTGGASPASSPKPAARSYGSSPASSPGVSRSYGGSPASSPGVPVNSASRYGSGSAGNVPVNASSPARYGGGIPASSPGVSRGYTGGGAGVPVNAAQPSRYGSGGSVPVSAPAARYGGGSGMAGDYGAAPVQHKKTWEQVRCPGCGATLAGRATVTIVAKEWYLRAPHPTFSLCVCHTSASLIVLCRVLCRVTGTLNVGSA